MILIATQITLLLSLRRWWPGLLLLGTSSQEYTYGGESEGARFPLSEARKWLGKPRWLNFSQAIDRAIVERLNRKCG